MSVSEPFTIRATFRATIPMLLALLLTIPLATFAATSPRLEMNISGSGWKLWLDKSAQWESDKLYLPPINIKSVPVNLPTGGWNSLYSAKDSMTVSVPGTVEEYHWDKLAEGKPKFPDTLKEENRASGDYRGVSWWWREINIPTSTKGKRVVVHFEAVRLRAEVFLNNELVGYDVIGNTPFDVDITGKIKPGKNVLAVRVTDPCGNFDWIDWYVQKWGDYNIPPSHGFGGIFEPVSLVVSDPVYVSDLCIKNKPLITSVDVDVTVANTSGESTSGKLELTVREAGKGGKVVFGETVPNVRLATGENVVTRSISMPNAKIWDTDHPNLYVCEVKLLTSNKLRDLKSDRFGFRFFTVTGEGSDAMFRLNDKRVFLQTSITWGFFPTNGLYPTKEMAVKQIKTAKAFGMNMLNFHRTLGNRMMLDLADEMGLMHYEEPGGYRNGNGDEFSAAWAREKLMRMIKRDRNHPSLVIYNMINESMREPLTNEYKDMADAHKLDPSRVVTFTSGWAKSMVDDPVKLHMLPYDGKQYIRGWFDWHNAPGPGVYRSSYYSDPKHFMLRMDNKQEIIFWGEEGAIGTPPRLELINRDLQKSGKNGWDGEWYRGWYQAYVDFLEKKNLRKYFPTVDALTKSMGDLALYYHGRIIENCRISNTTDAYVTNGWESELFECHSGIVDCWRNPKGDPNLISRYNRPLYVAVKVRNKVVQTQARVMSDFYVVNQIDLKGDFTLKASLEDPSGKTIWNKGWPVKIIGGDVFGELLAEKVEAETGEMPGYYTMRAVLVNGSGKVVADGDDQAFAVDWKSAPIPQGGAVIEAGDSISGFLNTQKNASLHPYSSSLRNIKYVLAGSFDDVVPTSCLLTPDGQPGLKAEYFTREDFSNKVAERIDAKIDSDILWRSKPVGISAEYYSVRWTGKLKPVKTGAYTISTLADDGARVWLDGRLIIDDWGAHPPTVTLSKPINMEAGKNYDIKVEYKQTWGEAVIKLGWAPPANTEVLDGILERVKNDGTTLAVISDTEKWAKLLSERGAITLSGIQQIGDTWVGGNIFVCEHPLFKDLPVNQGMNWEYQEIIPYWIKRFGLLLEGEEVVAGTVNYNEPRLGTAVGIVNYGKGKIILSTLDMSALNGDGGGADVVRKILCNYIEFAGKE